MRTVASLLILSGAVFALLAGLGQLRFRDLFVRMHVATKPATLGLALVLAGAAIRADGIAPSTKLVLAIVLQFVTAPVAAHLVGRAAHQAGAADDLDLVVDDLARDEATEADAT
jgi:multicomponent Na+:H+ antiporter subunit G